MVSWRYWWLCCIRVFMIKSCWWRDFLVCSFLFFLSFLSRLGNSLLSQVLRKKIKNYFILLKWSSDLTSEKKDVNLSISSESSLVFLNDFEDSFSFCYLVCLLKPAKDLLSIGFFEDIVSGMCCTVNNGCCCVLLLKLLILLVWVHFSHEQETRSH